MESPTQEYWSALPFSTPGALPPARDPIRSLLPLLHRQVDSLPLLHLGSPCLSFDQSLSRVQHFATPWTAAHPASLPLTIARVCPSSCSLHRLCCPAMSSSDAFFCPRFFPASRIFPMSPLFTSDDQNTGASASALVLPVNI